MDYRALPNCSESIMLSQLPDVRIDYQELIRCAKEVGKSVEDLSDEEKDVYISGSTISELRKNAIYGYY